MKKSNGRNGERVSRKALATLVVGLYAAAVYAQPSIRTAGNGFSSAVTPSTGEERQSGGPVPTHNPAIDCTTLDASGCSNQYSGLLLSSMSGVGGTQGGSSDSMAPGLQRDGTGSSLNGSDGAGAIGQSLGAANPGGAGHVGTGSGGKGTR